MWDDQKPVTVWGFSYSTRWLFSAFPGLRNKVRAFVTGEEKPDFFGIPVVTAPQAAERGLLNGESVVCLGDRSRADGEKMMEAVRDRGVPAGHIHTAAQFLKAYLSLWEPVEYTPSMVNIEACSLCQLNCAGCYMRTGGAGVIGNGWLSVEDLRNFLDQNPDVLTLELSNNGEVFLNPQLHEILTLCHERNVGVQMLNGVNLNTVSPQILEDMVRYRVRQILVSIDGATQEGYGQYRRGGKLDRVLENIRTINEWKRKLNSSEPALHWQFILMNENQQEVEAAVCMARELGMTIHFKQDWRGGFIPQDPAKLYRLTGMSCFNEKEFVEKEKHTYASDQYCRQMLLSPQINWDGRLLGCCTVTQSDWGINVFRTPLKEVFNNPDYRAAALSLLAGVDGCDHLGPCRDCGAFRINVQEQHHALQL